jgi:hypothetical protein
MIGSLGFLEKLFFIPISLILTLVLGAVIGNFIFTFCPEEEQSNGESVESAHVKLLCGTIVPGKVIIAYPPVSIYDS